MDYEKIGLKAGIEIHQRLDTKKLFCDCSTEMSEKSNAEIKRKLRPVAGELGKVDPAALHEFMKDKQFIYKTYPTESCLVESDSEPPHDLDKEALKISLKICKLLDCDIPDEIEIMRKTVIDGSNTGGFQRTAIVGMDGQLELNNKKIKIPSVCLEEEAARIEERKNGTVIYKLNGLGIPLVEITTTPVLKTPKEVKNVAKQIGLLLRSTKVKRGIGTIRQDVNVSIKNGARVEIKGFQELKQMDTLVENEVKRQMCLLEIKKTLKKKKAKKKNFKEKEVTKIFKNTNCGFIKKIVGNGGKVYAGVLPKFKGLMKKDCGGKRFGKELAFYAESFGPKGIIHDEEDLGKYNLKKEFEKLKEELSVKEKDVVFVVAGKGSKKAADKVLERAYLCKKKIPKETRIALSDATSKFARPLPGEARMYPETDISPVRITKKYLKELELPKTHKEKRKELKKHLSDELAQQIMNSGYYELFKEFIGFDPVMVATTLLSTLKELKQEGKKVKKAHLKKAFELVKKENMPKNQIKKVITLLIKDKSEKEIKEKMKTMSDDKLRQIIKDTVKEKPDLSNKALMGIIMGKIKGKASGKRVMKILNEVKD
mgnify:CR=1 FL=1